MSAMHQRVDLVQVFVSTEGYLQRGEAVLPSDRAIDAEALVIVAILISIAA